MSETPLPRSSSGADRESVPAPVRWLLYSSILLALFSTSLLVIVFGRGDAVVGGVAADRPVTPREGLNSDEQQSIAIFEEAAKSVVHITSVTTVRASGWGFRVRPREVVTGSGSGFIWDDQGHLVTNYHVVREAILQDRRAVRGEHVAWVTFGGVSSERYRATLVGFAGYKDLAVLKVEAPKELLRPIPIGTSSDLKVGQQSLVIGNPFGLDQSLTTGVVSALGREIQSVLQTTIRDVIQTDAAINPGNSGGPLLDSAGRLIGVNTAIYSPSGAYAGIGFAIPVDTVRRVIPDLIEFGSIQSPVLGIEINGSADQRLRIRGVMIWETAVGGGAADAGLRPVDQREGRYGDIIVAIDGKPVGDERELASILERYRPGDRVKVEVIRGFDPREGKGRKLEAEVELSARN